VRIPLPGGFEDGSIVAEERGVFIKKLLDWRVGVGGMCRRFRKEATPSHEVIRRSEDRVELNLHPGKLLFQCGKRLVAACGWAALQRDLA
jgi:hypothetical protein